MLEQVRRVLAEHLVRIMLNAVRVVAVVAGGSRVFRSLDEGTARRKRRRLAAFPNEAAREHHGVRATVQQVKEMVLPGEQPLHRAVQPHGSPQKPPGAGGGHLTEAVRW